MLAVWTWSSEEIMYRILNYQILDLVKCLTTELTAGFGLIKVFTTTSSL